MKKAAVAIIKTNDNKIALQQRDNNPEITNPGLISMFGGTLEGDESIEECLVRELLEELELNLKSHRFEKLGVYYKTIDVDGQDYEVNVFVVFDVDPKELKLHEGKEIKYLLREESLELLKLTRITNLAVKEFKEKFY